MYVDIIFALFNCLLCFWRVVATIRSRRLISVAWFLIAYFALFFLPVAMTKEMSWYRGFRAEFVKVGYPTIHKVIIYVLIFNIIFAISEVLISRLLFRKNGQTTLRWQLDSQEQNLRILNAVLGLFWFVGGGVVYMANSQQYLSGLRRGGKLGGGFSLGLQPAYRNHSYAKKMDSGDRALFAISLQCCALGCAFLCSPITSANHINWFLPG